MRYKTELTLVLAMTFVASGALKAQEENVSERYTAYELMSKYYNENFKPFKKKNIYVGLAFSLEDVSQKNTSGFLQDVIDGQSLDYSILLKTGSLRILRLWKHKVFPCHQPIRECRDR